MRLGRNTLAATGMLMALHSIAAPMKEEWVTRFSGERLHEIRAMATDSLGNVCIAATTRRTNTFYDMDSLFLKIGRTGGVQWSVPILRGISSHPAAIATDSAQNVVVAGWLGLSRSNSAAFIVKYDSTGALLWTNQVEGGSVTVQGLGIDAEDNVILATSTSLAFPERYFEVRKLDRNGVVAWVWRHDPELEGSSWLQGMVVDATGQAYVGINRTVRYQSAGFLTKLNRNGSEEWRWPVDFTMRSMALDKAGSVVVVGAGYFVRKISAAGDTLWARSYRGPAGLDRAEAVSIDGEDNVVVTGTSAGYPDEELYGDDYLTVKYDSRGNHLWTARYDGGLMDDARTLAVDAAGNSYVSGYWALVRYTPQGMQSWATNLTTAKFIAWQNALMVGESVRSQNSPNEFEFRIRKLVPDPAARLPRITRAPGSQRVPLLSNVVFSALAEGDGTLRYRWRSSDNRFPVFNSDSTQPAVDITRVVARHLGEYWVEISNDSETIASPVARLETIPRLTVSFSGEFLMAYGNFSYDYQLQMSTDLREWKPILNFVPHNGRWGMALDALGRTNQPAAVFRYGHKTRLPH